MMVDVPGRDGVVDEPGEEMMGEPDEDGVREVIGVVWCERKSCIYK